MVQLRGDKVTPQWWGLKCNEVFGVENVRGLESVVNLLRKMESGIKVSVNEVTMNEMPAVRRKLGRLMVNQLGRIGVFEGRRRRRGLEAAVRSKEHLLPALEV